MTASVANNDISYYASVRGEASGAGVADGISGSNIVKWVGAPIFGGLVGFVTWLSAGTPYGPALAALVSVVVAFCGLAFALYFDRTLGVLGAGAEPDGSPERQAYDRLRASLAEGNLPERLYAKWLTRFLGWVELFFGDKGMADRTLFPHAFGLKTPAPLWTAPTFDRCLLLALIYPIATIFFVWAISSHVGPAEAALGLPGNLSITQRALTTGTLGLAAAAFWFAFSVDGWRHVVLLLGGCGLVLGVAVLLTAASPFGAVVVAAASAAGGAAAAGFTDGAIAVAFVIGGPLAAPVHMMNRKAKEHELQPIFLVAYFAIMLVLCFSTARLLVPLPNSIEIGPLLLFLGLLTMMNAPFDWASLGLTRALLQRGLELKGWWPYSLALVDAALAGVIIALLALTMVIGVQAFNELAVHGGGPTAAVLPLDKLFDDIATTPAAPEYWWLYALLLSTMIPSLVNLVIGGMALTRGFPGLGKLLLNFMPVGKAVPAFNRTWLAAVLSAQVSVGIFLGIAAQALLAWALLFHLMPFVGLNLLDMARAVAAFDVPARIGALFGGLL